MSIFLLIIYLQLFMASTLVLPHGSTKYIYIYIYIYSYVSHYFENRRPSDLPSYASFHSTIQVVSGVSCVCSSVNIQEFRQNLCMEGLICTTLNIMLMHEITLWQRLSDVVLEQSDHSVRIF